jgi:hypothetical protein
MVGARRPITMRDVIAPTTEIASDADHPDPAHDLYANAAGLLASAQAAVAASHQPGAVAALAPTLACLETSLTALSGATERLRRQALAKLAEPLFEDDDLRRHRGEISARLERLAGVLEQASIAAEQALGAVDPVLDDLTV